MSFTGDSLERTDNTKPGEPSEPSETPGVIYGQLVHGRRFGPIMMVCLLVIGGGLVVYRYWGSGDGSGPQTAVAELTTPAPPVVAPTPVAEKKWVNPAFKDLTPRAANAIRAKVAESIVTQFFNTGESLNKYAVSLASPKPKRVKPPVKIAESKLLKPKPKPKPVIFPSLAAAGIDPGLFQVRAILFNGANSKAIINDAVYSVGQKVSGAVVVSITPKTITLKIDDMMFKVGM